MCNQPTKTSQLSLASLGVAKSSISFAGTKAGMSPLPDSIGIFAYITVSQNVHMRGLL